MASEAQLATLQAIALVVSAHRQNCGFKKISEVVSMNFHNIKNALINSFGNYEKSIILSIHSAPLRFDDGDKRVPGGVLHRSPRQQPSGRLHLSDYAHSGLCQFCFLVIFKFKNF